MSAATSTASATVAGLPSIKASGYSRSAVWCLKCASPRLQAFLALTILSPSACNSMSSQTQPQKVHVAYFTISIAVLSPLARLLVARTGRHQERSSQLPAAEAPARPARLVPAFFDHGP